MHHYHIKITTLPVLLEQVLTYLDPRAGDSYLDLTAGYGGHAKEILERTNFPSEAVLVDRDHHAVEVLRETFAGTGVQIIQKDFLSASREFIMDNRKFDVILADLGVSSPHLQIASRGFAITQEGPLDMRMDQSQDLTAADIVNEYSEADLAGILKRDGEEPKARQIARLIVQNRPIATTTELAHIVARAWPGHSKIHPATRTFQAFVSRSMTNSGCWPSSLPLWIELLEPGGRLAVISFHSLEDRLVKQAFAEVGGNRFDAELRLLTKHPVTASTQEIAFNPRARSAKLRAAAKIKTERNG